MCTRPARRRSKARRGTGWSRDCARTGIAACARLPGRRIWLPLLRAEARPGDMVVCLGAGSITNWANALPEELAKPDMQDRVA